MCIAGCSEMAVSETNVFPLKCSTCCVFTYLEAKSCSVALAVPAPAMQSRRAVNSVEEEDNPSRKRASLRP